MGTRGTWGFRKDGIDKTVYCHYDSYPECLGEHFVRLILTFGRKNLSYFFDQITVMDTNVPPTNEQKQHCKELGWYNGNVSMQNDDDWYCLLRELQDPEEWHNVIHANAEIYIENSIDFINDSLFCEWAYIYDLDKDRLEVYKGFQKTPFENNPYGENDEDNDGYYPCAPFCAFSGIELNEFACNIGLWSKLVYRLGKLTWKVDSRTGEWDISDDNDVQ